MDYLNGVPVLDLTIYLGLVSAKRHVSVRFSTIFYAALLATSPAGAAQPALSDSTTPGHCLTQLDRSVALYHDQDYLAASSLLVRLDKECKYLPQIQHNLGVIDAQQERWDAAIVHFRDALKTDTRAAMTYQHLQSIHRYRARLAYQQALNIELESSDLELRMQDASQHNSDTLLVRQSTAELHSISTIEYELYDWWLVANEVNLEAWAEHYADGYPPPDISPPIKKIGWSSVQREISFTAQDAVVILSFDDLQHRSVHTLLLLRLQGNRWKIYQETRL